MRRLFVAAAAVCALTLPILAQNPRTAQPPQTPPAGAPATQSQRPPQAPLRSHEWAIDGSDSAALAQDVPVLQHIPAVEIAPTERRGSARGGRNLREITDEQPLLVRRRARGRAPGHSEGDGAAGCARP